MTGLTLLLLLVGCDIPKRPPLDPPDPAEVERSPTSVAAIEPAIEPPERIFGQDWEAWDAYYLQDEHVGFSHTTAEALVGDAIANLSDPNVQYSLVDQIRFRRGSGNFVQHLEQTSTESPQGSLISFNSKLHVGPIVKQFRGVVKDNKLTVETVRGSTRSSKSIDWQSTYRGLFAVQQSLRRKPMQRYEQRTLQTLTPIQHAMTAVRLYCTGSAAITMLDQTTEKLNEIEVQYVMSDDAIVGQVIWTNDEGEIQKTWRPADKLSSYRTDKSTAMNGAIAPDDLIHSTTIDVKGTLARPDEVSQVAFVIVPNESLSDDQKLQLPPQPQQYVRLLDDGSFHVLVSRDVSPPAGFSTATLAPVQGDLGANHFIDFEDKRLQTMAKTFASNKHEIAIELASEVQKWIEPKSVSNGMTKASVIADMVDGAAYLERAILLAALLRCREIPSRLALGFIYVPGAKPQMAFHVWNLAHVDGKWLALDGSLGKAAPADRIMITTTNLGDGDEYASFEPLMQMLGQFSIEIRGVRYPKAKASSGG